MKEIGSSTSSSSETVVKLRGQSTDSLPQVQKELEHLDWVLRLQKTLNTNLQLYLYKWAKIKNPKEIILTRDILVLFWIYVHSIC